jgi:NADH dehydrogenase (ubiquinone) 1 alpha subcomplex subunit 9
MQSLGKALRSAGSGRCAPLAALQPAWLSSASDALPLSVEQSLAERGPGGRHSVSGLRVCVFGSTGFLGRYVVNALGKTGSTVSLPTRCSDNNRQHLRVMGDLGQIVFWDAPHDLIRNDEAIRRARDATLAAAPRSRWFSRSVLKPSPPRAPSSKALSGCNAVVNLLGRDFETGRYSFSDVNVEAAGRVARAAAAAGVKRLVHFSALGAAADAPSALLRSKAAGEDAVRAAFPTATVVRPAPMFGQEDRLLRSWAACAKVLPFIPLIDGGRTRMAPVDVRDVASAVAAALARDDAAGVTYTLAGPQVFTVAELVALVFSTTRMRPRTLSVPAALATLAATPRDLLQTLVPFPVPVLPAAMYTRDGVAAMAADYVPPPGAPGLAELGVSAHKLEGLTIDYLRSFRAGGYEHGETAGVQSA